MGEDQRRVKAMQPERTDLSKSTSPEEPDVSPDENRATNFCRIRVRVPHTSIMAPTWRLNVC